MKKVISIILLFLLLTGSASAITVSEFVERYNQRVGKGFYTAYMNQDNIIDNTWFITGPDTRQMVALKLVPDFSNDPTQAIIETIFIRQTRRVSISTFINNTVSALSAAFPDISEETIMVEIVKCLRTRDNLFGYEYTEEAAIPYHSPVFGEMVYQESSSNNTILVNVIQ